MLKGIPPVISPDLMGVLMSMGHGDEIVFADGNFPSASVARLLLRADGHGVPPLLDAVMRFFPLDPFVARPAALMAVVPGHEAPTPIWNDYREILRRHEPAFDDFDFLERFAFYERARRAYAVVATGEKAVYANIILKKGLVKPDIGPGET